jgi:hypothetical protein
MARMRNKLTARAAGAGLSSARSRTTPWTADVPQRLALAIVDNVGGARRFAVQETLGTLGVEAKHPIAQLQSDTANPRRVRARAAGINLRKRQKTAGLIGITRGASLRTKAASKSGQKQNWSRHGKLLIAHVSQTQRLRLGPFGHQTAVQELNDGTLDNLFDFLRRWRLAQTNEALQPHGS